MDERAADYAERVIRNLEIELLDRLADHGAGHQQRLHQHEGCELPEIRGNADRRAVASVGEGDDAVCHLPAVQSLAESVVNRLLDGAIEGERQGAEFAEIA